MSTPAGIIGSRLTTGVGEAASFAGGVAIAPTLAPLLRELENVTWALHPDKRIDLLLAAEVVAEDVDQLDPMVTEVAQSGWDKTRLLWAYGVTLNAPGEGTLLNLLRRSEEQPIDFTHGLRKARLETQWDDALRNLRYNRIAATDLAYMVVRGVVADAGTLPSPLPTQADRLQLPPQTTIDTLKEARLTGWDEERFAAMVARSGLAMAPVMAAQANFRGILTDNDYALTIARGDLFPAYADPVKEVSRQILTADQYLEGALRGWISFKDGVDGAAKHGMSPADAQLLYEIRRRPLTPHTITEALAKGGVFQPAPGEIQDPYDAAVHQQDLGPEWYDLAKAQRFSPPSLFVIRQLLKDGVYTIEHAELRMRQLGIFPEDATLIAQAYAPTGGGTADPHVTKAANQLWTATHKAYLNGELPAADVAAPLNAIGVAATAQPHVLALWNQEQQLVRKGITAAQYKKAYEKQDVNDSTGQPWTRDETIAELVRLGYSHAEANQYLDIG